MKALILTEAGKGIGFGHITRCISIYQALEEAAVQSQLIVNGDGNTHTLLGGTNHKVFNWLNDHLTLLKLLDNIEIVFIDSYLAGFDVYEKISNIVQTCVYFDDNMRVDYPSSFVVNGAVFAEQMPYLAKDGVTYLLGSRYAPVRKEFWEVHPRRIRNSVEVIMITVGGADNFNITPKVLKLIVDEHPETIKKVTIGAAFENIREIEHVKDKKTKLIYSPTCKEMKGIMVESDIAICACGQTLYELARTGAVPIGICVAQNQLKNVEGWTKLGFLQYVGWYNDTDLEQKLKRCIKKTIDLNARKEISKIGNEVIDGQGARRIVKAILGC